MSICECKGNKFCSICTALSELDLSDVCKSTIDRKEENKKELIRTVLEQCHKKITLYNKANQEYLGGVEATRLLQNIKDVIKIIDN